MAPSQAEDWELNAKVKMDVQAEFDVDLLDHVSLADRRRVAHSDNPVWNADMAARHVSPSILKDFFLEDLARVMKPVTSLFTGEKGSSCGHVKAQSHHEQMYSVVLLDGRIAKVIVNTSAINSNSMQTYSPNNVKERGDLHRFMLNLPTTKSPAFDTKAHSTSRFSITMNFRPSESSSTYSSVDYLPHDDVKLRNHKYVSVRNGACDIILQEDPIMLLLPETRRQQSHASDSCVAHANRRDHATDQEKDGAFSCSPQNSGEAIHHMQMHLLSDSAKENVLCNDKEHESHMALSTPKGAYTLSQQRLGSSDYLDNVSLSLQEANPPPLHLSLANEVPVIREWEACLGANNQILEPLPLTIQDAMDNETSTDQLLEASNIWPLHSQSSSEDGGDHYSRSSNLQENKIVKITNSNSISRESHDINLAPPVLQKRVKLEPNKEAFSNCIDVCATASCLQENKEDNVENTCRTSVSEVKATVFGQKRVQCNSDNKVTDSSPLSSPVRVKKEPVELNDLDNCTYMTHISSSGLSKTQPCTAINCEECISPLANHPGKCLPVNGLNQASSIANEHVPESVKDISFNVKPEILEEMPVVASGNPGMHLNGCSSLEFPFNAKKEILVTSTAPLKMEFPKESSVDELDFIPLQDRRKMLMHNREPHFNFCSHSNRLEEIQPCLTAEASLSSHMNRRKRKRTATNSVETALQEDAPELLQVLIDNGIDPNDIKLYESMNGDDDALFIGSSEGSFDELESVILKLFCERQNLFNLGSLQEEKGSKTVYSLACLVSLIEQARYMRLKNCPVEWGWCRDLLSFVFVFEKHNRIVLERPEYGYATYFFELVESFPVDWQIKRLVTALKLTRSSRSILLENKSLVIGEDLTEGEARVLGQYGWTPNSGLGSLLNFCDRVIHDRINEMGSSDWRAKIGKMLKNGFDRGRVVISELPKKVSEYINNQQQAFKLELCQD